LTAPIPIRRDRNGRAGPSAEALDAIKAVVGAKGWTEDPAEIEPRVVDERGRYRGATPLLVRPASTEQVARVLALCHRHRVPVVPQGGNTSLVGASVPHATGAEIVLSLARMNRIRSLDPLNYALIAEAGCVLADLQRAAEDADRLFPLSLGAEGSCQIGGNLSTNAGGVQVLRYGSARDLALGLEVVLPDGRVLDELSTLRKNNTGYDLKQLFIGAEGTLGVITAAALKLFPRPRDVQTAMAAVAGPEAAIEVLARAREASGDAVTAFELMPRIAIDLAIETIPGVVDPLAGGHGHYVLIEMSSPRSAGDLREALEAMLGQAHEDGLVLDATIAASADQARRLWRVRDAIPEAQKITGGGIKHDVAVPITAVPTFLAQATAACEARLAGVRVLAFGHAGDGNIHFNLARPAGMDLTAFLDLTPDFNRLVHDLAVALGGSISAEHGIGQLKRAELARTASPAALDTMRAIKAALDPHDIMNPGKVIPDPDPEAKE